MRLLILIFLAIFLGGIFMFGYMHERVHQTIYSDYGIKSKIKSEVPNFVTTPEKSCPSENCELAHEINEVVGYHLLPFYAIIGLGFFCIIILLEEGKINSSYWIERRKKEQEEKEEEKENEKKKEI